MKMSFSQERAIIALGLHSFRGDSVGGSKLTEQTLPVRNTGLYSHKNLLAHCPDFLIFSCLQQANFILQVEGRVVSLFVIE